MHSRVKLDLRLLTVLPGLGIGSLATPAFAVTIDQESFETDGSGGLRYTVSREFDDGVNDYFTRADVSTDPESPNLDLSGSTDRYRGFDGDFLYAGEDLDDGGGDGLDTKSITFNSVDTSTFTDLGFTGSFAAGNNGGAGASKYDSTDFMLVDYSTDRGATFNDGVQFRYQDHGDAYNEPLALDADFDGDGEGTVLGQTFHDFSFDIPDAANTVTLRFTTHMDSADEEIAIDNFRITGVPEPTSLILMGLGSMMLLGRPRPNQSRIL